VTSRHGKSVRGIAPYNHPILDGAVKTPMPVEIRTLTGRRCMDVEKLTDRLNAPVQGTGADGLKVALAFLWERKGECPGAIPVLVCHDEVVVECDAEQAADAKVWLEKAMIEGMSGVINGTNGVDVPVEVAARIGRSWGEGR
jgi:DNA polymerase-1